MEFIEEDSASTRTPEFSSHSILSRGSGALFRLNCIGFSNGFFLVVPFEAPTSTTTLDISSYTAAATYAAPAAVSSAAPAVAPAAASSLELSIGSVRTLSSPIVHATQDEPSEKRKKLNGTSSPPEPPTRDFPIFRFSFKGACCIDALFSPSRLRFRRCSLLLSSSVHPLPSSRLLFLPPVDFLATHRVSTFSEVSHISPHFRQSW